MPTREMSASHFADDIRDLLTCLVGGEVPGVRSASSLGQDGIIIYIGLDALILNKQASGRPKDLDDLRYLKRARAKRRGR